MPPRRRLPAPHWGLLVVVLLVMLLSLFLHGLSRDLDSSGTADVPARAAEVPGGGAVVFRDEDGELSSRELPPRTVALTFEDGPDPRWTPQVLDVLAREGVPATFFATGSSAVQHPELVRRTLRAGHEVGNHTWSHERLASAPAWRRNLELSLSQLGLAGGAQVTTALFRPPYSGHVGTLSQDDLEVLRTATDAGYVVVLSDRDPKDWTSPGVDQIVDRAGPVGSAGAIVALHDAGGNRSQTLEALPRLIEEYRTAGYRFTTVSGGLGLAPAAGVQPVGALTRAQGLTLLMLDQAGRVLSAGLLLLLLPLGALAVLRTLLLMGFARWHVGVATRRLGEEEHLPPVTVLVPAYNEEVGIAATLHSIVGSDHPDLEVVVIDDGSTDDTARIVEELALPRVRLVRQANAGKAAALTNGLSQAEHDVIVMVDGDTVFEPTALRRLVQPLADPKVGAVSGNTKVGNRRGLLGRWQHLEYVVGFNLDRRLYDLLRCMPTVPGAIGAFRRQALEQVGGVSSDTLAEDTDVTMAVSRLGWRVVYEERAIAWTEAPSTWTALWRQRYRWCYGTLQSVWKHRGAVREKGDGRWLGLVGLPYLLAFQVLLPLLAPIIDVFAVYGLLFLDPGSVAAYWLGFLLLQVVAAAYALRLDKESLRPLWVLPLQQVVYRQLMYLVVIQSVVSALSGIRLPWHKLERTGMDDLPATREPAVVRR